MRFGISRRSLAIRAGVAGIAGAMALGSMTSLAVHENIEFPAAIHAGTCEAPGDVVMELPNLVRLPENAPDEGEPTGAPGPQVVHGLPDDTAIDLAVDDLFAADHILAVFDAEGANIVACGPIGAYTYEDGQDLAFGLRSQGESPYSGVALIDIDDEDEDEALDIEVYLVNNTPAPAATPAA